MKILFITQYYPPEIGAAANRIGYFAQFLAKRGHEVAVLGTIPNYPEGKIYPGYQNRFTEERKDGVRIYRTRIFLSAKKKPLARLLHYFSFVFFALLARKKIPKPDCVVATVPPLFTGIIGVVFKKFWKIPLVIDIRDLWPQSVESVGAVKKKALLRQAEKLARLIYSSSDRIIVTSPGILQGLQTPSSKLQAHILPNGADLDLFRPNVQGDHIRAQWKLQNRFVILYTGNLGLAQAPAVMLQAAEVILRQAQDDKETREIIFLIVGAGVLLPELQRMVREKNLVNVIFTGSQPRELMPEYVASADICIIPYKAAETFRSTLPSKMFDYMAGGKPILINLKGEASALLEEAQCGIVIAEEDPQSLADGILSLKKNQARLRELGKNGRAFVERHYRREIVAEKLENLLCELHSKSSS